MIMSSVKDKRNFIIIAIQNLTEEIRRILKRLSDLRYLPDRAVVLMILLLSVVVSCRPGGTKKLNETPTRGNIRIMADESFEPLVDTEVKTFTSLYQNATIKADFKAEVDLINDFMNDSVKVIVTSKKLTEDQIQYLRDTLIVARTTSFAWDALALITNRDNKDTLLRYSNIRDIFKGRIKNWKDINPGSDRNEISVIFDNTKSGNIRYFKELFEIDSTLGENFFAVNSNAEVVDFVSRNPDALGIISVNWISDKDDSLSMSFSKRVNIIAVSQELYDGYYYRPYQGFIYDKSYPFVREIFFISRETFTGLGSGFIQFATAEQGQKIVLKSGLVPAMMPIRLVQIKQ